MWNDEKFRRLSAPPPNGQTLWQRLLTGPELGPVPGLFQAWEAGLAQALGWPLEAFQEAFWEVSREGLAKADWEAGLVWVPRAVKHNEPQSPNVVRGWAKEWKELPECALKDQAFSHLKAFVKGLPLGFRKAFDEAFQEALAKVCPNQEQEQEQEQELLPVDVDPNLTGHGTELPPPTASAAAKVPCPAGLALTGDQRATLEMHLPGWAIDLLTPEYVAKWQDGDRDRWRTLEQWRSSLVTAITGRWNNRATRPTKPRPEEVTPREPTDEECVELMRKQNEYIRRQAAKGRTG